jgi:Fe-S-cluster-containing hydrogenase component 2
MYYFSKIGETFDIVTPEEPSCKQCRHFCGFSQMEIDYDTGDMMESVRCDVQVFATPDYAKNCPYRQLKVVKK